MCQRILKQGKGWRLGWTRDPLPYQALVGGDDWAMELTAAEFADFCRLTAQLNQTMNQMREVLMEEEKIACEAESDLVWLEGEGFPQSYSLRLILQKGRSCEGNWSAEAVKELIKALETFQVF
ncbi:MAG: hypothetical protein N5P05_000923 [Chroococcopsis gigantea SAG 12.99]|jgi:hypothetical protein|nr:DUF1818 family protein [Chlorogloea purpurea SAG 13.99]MDV2999317.1 hypothetical protein [Chroococcopsis gigantea SAG 12.99]